MGYFVSEDCKDLLKDVHNFCENEMKEQVLCPIVLKAPPVPVSIRYPDKTSYMIIQRPPDDA